MADSRRRLLQVGALGGVGAAVLAACGETKEIIKEVPVEVIKEVEVAGEPVVKEVERIVEVPGETQIVEKIVEVEVAPVVTSVNVWFNQASQMDNFNDKVVDHYHRSQDRYKLEVIFVANTDLTTKLTTAIAGDAPPDAIRIGGITIAATFYRAGAFVALNDFDPDVMTYDWSPGIMEVYVHEGNLYSIPTNTGTQSFYYNGALYREAGLDPDVPPADFDEMIENSARIRSLGETTWGMEFPITPNSIGLNITHAFRKGFGRETAVVSDDGLTVQFTSDRMIEYFEWIKTNVAEGGHMPVKIIDEAGITNEFGTGLVGQYVAFPSRLQNAIEDLGRDDAKVARMPAGPYSNDLPGGNCGTLNIPVRGQNVEGGWDFTNFIMGDPENASIWAAAFGQLPTRLSYRDSVTYSAYRAATPQVDAFLTGLENGTIFYHGPAVNEVVAAYSKAIEAVAFGGDPAETLGQKEEQAQEALDQRYRRWREPVLLGPGGLAAIMVC
jgi:sn-glycerol 3-phosphate transport system substrate-binding protein